MAFLKKLFGGNKGNEEAPPSPQPAMPEPEPEPLQIQQILATELKARLDQGDDVLVIDMRQNWEYESGHIPGAKHMFIQEIPHRLHELPQDTDIVFQCWHGNTSQDASAFLIQNGWEADRVSSLVGGISGWVQTFGLEGLVKETS